jgi:cyclic pyranopterin phosphate synthase
MVDVGEKSPSRRVAVAEGRIRMSSEAFALVRENAVAKGDVLRIAEVAGTMGGKRTAELIPLCHPIPLDALRVECAAEEGLPGVRVTATASVTARTGVEMEALTAVGIACLTVYDMVKAVDREMVIEGIRLLMKTGGTRGDWHGSEAATRAS